jgi:hypothetical protein
MQGLSSLDWDQDLVTSKQHPTRSNTEMRNSKMSNSDAGSIGWASKGNSEKPWESPKHRIPRP